MGIFNGFKRRKRPINEEIKMNNENPQVEPEIEIETVNLGKKPTEYDIRNYVDSNCTKMLAAAGENREFKREYEKVTGYLKDIESIENMQPERKLKLISVAAEIVELTRKQKMASKHAGTISSAQYKSMQQYEDIMNSELVSIKRKEKFQMDIKSDMRHLEGEKAGLAYEQRYRYNRHGFYKTLSIGLAFIVISIMAFLAVLALYSDMDMTMPFIAVIAASGLMILLLFMSVRKNRYETELAGRKINKAINLLNSAKIKYINTTALLDYLYSKYNVKNADELEYVWSQYLRIKNEEEQLRETKARIDELENVMLIMLKEEEISDTNIWTSQVVAIIESREMVEVRHKLNVRRGKLREQIAYNDEIYAESAKRLETLKKGNPQVNDIIKEVAKAKGVSPEVFTAQQL